MEVKKAFTMAEILLTLAIIGVVSAMTLPLLKTAREKKVAVTGFQKAYSTLTQMVQSSEADNGFVNDWDFSYTAYDQDGTNLTFFNQYFKPYLKITKSCGGTNGSGCWAYPIYKPNGNNFAAQPEIDVHFLKYILSDGMSLAIIFRGTNAIEIKVDINGPKKPNTMGKDIFDFILTRNNKIYTYNIKTGGVYFNGYGVDIGNTYYDSYGCSLSVNGDYAGSYCGAKIINDGYQIKDDYPWK